MDEFWIGVCAGVGVFALCSVIYLQRVMERSVVQVAPLLHEGEAVLSGISETLDERIQRECAEQLAPHLAHLATELHGAYSAGAHRGDLEVLVPESYREEMIGWTIYGVPIRRSPVVCEPTVRPKEKEAW